MHLKYIGVLVFVAIVFSLTGLYPAGHDPAGNFLLSPSTKKPTPDSCYFRGIPLHGKVKFVTSFPDIKVKFVSSFPDLKVKFVSSFPDECGEWQVVESFPDFKIQVVESFADIEIKVVESFPGLP